MHIDLRHRERVFTVAGAIALLLLTAFAFGRSLTFGFAPIDDAYLVVQNLTTRGPTLDHLRTAFTTFDPELYIPLTLVSFQMNFLISGLAPWSYHLGNLLLHGCNAVLLFLILKKLTAAPRPFDSSHRLVAQGALSTVEGRASLFAAALFAVHPINAEAVVWIAARKDLLSTLFAFAAILAYVQENNERQWPRGIAALCLFLCALLAKVSVAPLPVAFLLLDRMRGNDLRKSLKRTAPFFLLSAIFLLIALLGKERIVQTASITETLLLIPRSTLFLLGKFLLPRNLSPLYEVTDPVALTNPAILFPLLAFFAFFAFLFSRTREGVRLRSPTLTLTLALAFVLLSPAFLTFRKAGTLFLASDRYLYLPELGLLLLIVLLSKAIGDRFTVPRAAIAQHQFSHPRELECNDEVDVFQIPKLALGGFLLAFLTVVAMKQTNVWSSPEALFTHALETNPRSVAARTALAHVLLSADKPEQAFDVLKEGLKLGDPSTALGTGDPRLHLAAGNVYAHTGQIQDALAQFKKVLAMDPGNADAPFSIGSIEEQTGSLDTALVHYRAAVSADPSNVPALNGIGRILLGKNDLQGAEEQFRTALKWNPNSIDAHRGLADVIEKQGKTEEAEEHRRLAAELSTP